MLYNRVVLVFMMLQNCKVVIFYGSQTGTAEDFSARLTKDLRRMGIGCTVQDPEDHDMDNLVSLTQVENSLVLFVVATYGEGDPTDNARQLHEWLGNTESDLTGVRYTVRKCRHLCGFHDPDKQ